MMQYAAELDDVILLNKILDMMYSVHIDLIKINKYFRINFVLGNTKICEYFLNKYSDISFKKIDNIEQDDPIKFKILLNMYVKHNKNISEKFILNIEKKLLNYQNNQDILEYQQIIIDHTLDKLFIDCNNSKIFTFDLLFNNYKEKILKCTLLEYINACSQYSNDKYYDNVCKTFEIYDIDDLKYSFTTIKEIFENASKNNNIQIFKFIYDKTQSKINIDEFFLKLFSKLTPNTVHIFNLLLSRTDKYQDILLDYSKRSTKNSHYTYINILLDKIPVVSYDVIKNLASSGNNNNIIKLIFDSNKIDNMITEKEYIELIKSITETEDYQILLEYLLDKIEMTEDIYNQLIGFMYSKKSVKYIDPMILVLKKYNLSLKFDDYYLTINNYYTYGSGYTITTKKDDITKIMENIIGLKNIELLTLFINKSDNIIIQTDLIKSVLNIPGITLDTLNFILKNVIWTINIIKDILKTRNLKQDIFDFILTKINQDELYMIASDILLFYCSSDNLLEQNKLLLDKNPDIMSGVVVLDLFVKACENNAVNTAKWLLLLYPDLEIYSNQDKLFLDSCKNNRIIIAELLSDLCPWYTVIIRNKKIVYYDCNKKEYLLELLDKINAGNIKKALKKLKIKNLDEKIEHECYICKDDHNDILRTDCGHYYCLKSIIEYWKIHDSYNLTCFYCKKNIELKKCVNYKN
jgi:hypothetical protein